jgi:hypothetical protein
VAPQVRKWSFFSTKLYRDHIESYLSELSYSELVQGQLEKMAFSLVDLLLEIGRPLILIKWGAILLEVTEAGYIIGPNWGGKLGGKS